MNGSTQHRARDLAGGASAWLATGLALPLLLHEFLLGLDTFTDPRVIEAATGVLSGALAFGIAARLARGSARFLSLARPVLVLAFLVLSVLAPWMTIIASLGIRFSLVSAAIPATFLATKRNARRDPWGSTAPAAIAMVLAGSLWIQREAYYSWPAPLQAVVLGAAAGAVVAGALASRGSREEDASMPDNAEITSIRAPGAAAAIALFLGTLPGLYMSLGKLVVENTAVDRPATLVAIMNAAIISAIVIFTVTGAATTGRSRIARAAERPVGLAILLAIAADTVGLPWILGTMRVINDTTAGTWHVAGLVAVPLLGAFMLARLGTIEMTPGYPGLVAVLGGLGLVIGIAGYLSGGTTYNMDVYIGAAFTLLLGLGIATAWTCKQREATREVTTFATA